MVSSTAAAARGHTVPFALLLYAVAIDKRALAMSVPTHRCVNGGSQRGVNEGGRGVRGGAEGSEDWRGCSGGGRAGGRLWPKPAPVIFVNRIIALNANCSKYLGHQERKMSWASGQVDIHGDIWSRDFYRLLLS
jgi:hypothetical protein